LDSDLFEKAFLSPANKAEESFTTATLSFSGEWSIFKGSNKLSESPLVRFLLCIEAGALRCCPAASGTRLCPIPPSGESSLELFLNNCDIIDNIPFDFPLSLGGASFTFCAEYPKLDCTRCCEPLAFKTLAFLARKASLSAELLLMEGELCSSVSLCRVFVMGAYDVSDSEGEQAYPPYTPLKKYRPL
jgi:hypothetical protein